MELDNLGLKNSTAFEHFAMNTTFGIRFPNTLKADRELYAIAGECFKEVDRLEMLFSRYQEESEIAQINRLKTGESLILHEDTYSIIQLGIEMYGLSNGLFNITIGHQTWSEENLENMDPFVKDDSGSFYIHPDKPMINCIKEGRQFDLGGIGKGFALDYMKNILIDLSIPNALVYAGNSTYLAIGNESWEIELIGNDGSKKIHLKDEALSASGTAIQGEHIINPFEGLPSPYLSSNIWVTTKGAAIADASSTSCILMDKTAILEMQKDQQNKLTVYVESLERKEILLIT